MLSSGLIEFICPAIPGELAGSIAVVSTGPAYRCTYISTPPI